MQPCAVGCGDRNSWCGVFRRTGRPPAGLCQAKNGPRFWDVDTMQDYATLNGVSAHGGSLDGPGPVIA